MAKTNTIKFDLATSTATTIIKEENAMTKRMEEINKALVNNQKVQDAGYIKKNDLMDILNNEFNMGFSKKNTRAEMVDAFMAMYKDAIRVADEIAYGNMESNDSIQVGDLDITRDNAPVVPVAIIKEDTITYEDSMSMDILKAVILQADTNKATNFISDWMLGSKISELIIGKPFKGKVNGEWIEFHKSFTDTQKKNINAIKAEFLKRSKFVPVKDPSKNNAIVGYVIPAKSLIYGRHTWLNAACIYHYIDKATNKLTVYHVSRNGIKNTTTDNITPLDDKAYAILDSRCKFIR